MRAHIRDAVDRGVRGAADLPFARFRAGERVAEIAVRILALRP
ncbi:hypothetical protein AB0M46_46100 [Dactylosporangium sp. NPDC051485]